MYQKLLKIMNELENHTVLSAVRKGFMLTIPVLLTGSVALLIKNFPVPAVTAFLQTFAGGVLDTFLLFVFDSTVGFMSAYLVLAISYYYSASFVRENTDFRVMAMFTSLICFIASFGAASGSLTLSSFGSIGVFTAIVSSIVATRLFCFISDWTYRQFRAYGAGADAHYRTSMTAIVPLAVCVALFVVANLLLNKLFHVSNFNELISTALVAAFENIQGEPENGIWFTVLQSVLWVFGIHGGNALDEVSKTVFVAQEGVSSIITKSFLDNFAVIGGSGATICLCIAMFIAARSYGNRRLAYSSAPFILFNINETLMFGYPIVLNPILMLPFIAVPLVSLLIAYGAAAVGFMPIAQESVMWTTPVLFSGYMASGSWRGVLVQAVIVAVGTGIYIPFVRLSERIQRNRDAYMLDKLTDAFRENERLPYPVSYLTRGDDIGLVAKSMLSKLRDDIARGQIVLHYQPQVNHDGEVVAAEALLRWEFAQKRVYPPLIVSLAKEDGCFDQLTWLILTTVCQNMQRARRETGVDTSVSINIIARQLDDLSFVQRVIALVREYDMEGTVSLEVTEESSPEEYNNIPQHIDMLQKTGIGLSIDDFSMGSTSLNYLRNNRFKYVKLDGTLIRSILENDRSRQIVSTLIDLGQRLDFQVVAEYVENEEIRRVLIDLGCHFFQGYLYSPALPLDEFIDYLKAAPGSKGSPPG